ncbi:MAG: hypothetical protein GY756_09015 [bacterium]|nr:hypothetical protein [bacterium]
MNTQNELVKDLNNILESILDINQQSLNHTHVHTLLRRAKKDVSDAILSLDAYK